uniref:Uncharacterized protein n=1 Tax=Oryza nivara TaxID=4536 RepID=A0A0E0JCP6_ORYNI
MPSFSHGSAPSSESSNHTISFISTPEIGISMSVFCRPFQRPVNRRLAFNPINPATPIDQHFVSSSDGPTVPGVQSLPAVRGKGAGPDDFSSSYRCVQRCISPQVNARHCDVRIARNNGMSTTIGASPSSRIAQNDTSLHREILYPFLPVDIALLYMVMKFPLGVDAKFNSAYYFRITNARGNARGIE